MHSNAISLDASQHTLRSVTIFQSSMAEVTRTLTVGLRSGRNVIEISGLSSNIDVASASTHDLGSLARIVDVCCDIATVTSSRTDQLTENLRKELSAERALRQQEYDALEDATSSLLSNVGSTNIDKILDGIVERKRKAMNAVLELDQKVFRIDQEVQLTCKKHQGDAAAVVSVTVLAEHDCDVELRLTYLVSGANWTPYYHLLAWTRDGKPDSDVMLHYCARIVQTTGEDWNDAAVILSSANTRALHSLTVPSIEPLKMSTSGLPVSRGRNQDPRGDTNGDRARYDDPYYARHRAHSRSPSGPYRRRQSSSVLRRLSRSRSRSRPRRPHSRPRRPHSCSPRPRSRSPRPRSRSPRPPSRSRRSRSRPVDPAQAGVSSSPVSISYHIGGEVSLPSDGLVHTLSIAALDLFAELRHVCVPRQVHWAYIKGTIKNTSDYELLAGPVDVFMDNGFVTSTSIGHVSANESFVCVLDTALKVSYQAQETRAEDLKVRWTKVVDGQGREKDKAPGNTTRSLYTRMARFWSQLCKVSHISVRSAGRAASDDREAPEMLKNAGYIVH